MSNIEYEFIPAEGLWYEQAVAMRHRVFFAPTGHSINHVFDQDESASAHLVAVDQDKVVGYGRLTLRGAAGHISQMVVDEACRHQNVGSGLMDRLIRKAQKSGAATLFLNAKVEVRDFYRRFGFAPIGPVFPSKKTGLPHQRMERIVGSGEVA